MFALGNMRSLRRKLLNYLFVFGTLFLSGFVIHFLWSTVGNSTQDLYSDLYGALRWSGIMTALFVPVYFLVLLRLGRWLKKFKK